MLQTGDWSQYPFLVDLNGKEPQVLEEDDEIVQTLSGDLLTLLLPLVSSTATLSAGMKTELNGQSSKPFLSPTIPTRYEPCQVVSLDTENSHTFTAGGLPFIAGWLLGYPCVYLSDHPQNALSMEPLFKHSLSFEGISRPHPDEVKKVGTTTSSFEVDLMEFTVPRCAIDEYPQRASRLVELLQNRHRQLQTTLLNLSQKNDEQNIHLEGSIQLQCTEIILAQVVL
jgi:hypothetical protein